MKSRPAWGTAPIKCGNRKCGWTGTEKDLVPHPDDVGKFGVRSVCPKCHADSYSFPRRKSVHSCSIVTETVARTLPCPFCGEAPSTSSRPNNAQGTEFFAAVACYCGGYSACAHKMATASTQAEADALACAAWNTRK